MTTSIGIPLTSGTTAASGASTVAGRSASGNNQASISSLQAQLDQYQKQLADCVNCASAKTSAGKQEIASISAKISSVKQRIDNITENTAKSKNSAASIQPTNPSIHPVHNQSTSGTLSVGSIVNIIA